MANPTDHPFLPATFPTWPQILAATVTAFPAQTHQNVLDTLKIDAGPLIQPLQIVTNVGSIWSNTVDTFMRVAWPAIVQVLSGSTGSWVGLSDTVPATPFSLSDVGKVPTIVNMGGTAKLDLINGDEPSMSGILTIGSGALTKVGSTDVNVAAGVGQLTERIAGGGRVYHDVVWSAITITADTGSAGNIWYVDDVGFTGTGTVKKTTSPLSVAARRLSIRLGVSLHDEVAGEVDDVLDIPDIAGDHGQLLNDLLDLGQAVSVESGNLLEIAATLTFDRTQTILFGRGINGATSFVDPNHITIAAAGGAQVFDTIKPDGTAFAEGITTVPKTWNNAGVETALTGKKAAVHQVAILSDGEVFVQLGTTQYDNYADAVSAISLEKVVNPLWPILGLFGARMGNAVVSNSAGTQWEDGLAHLFPDTGGAGGGGTGGVTTFVGLGDTPNTYPGGSAGNFVIVGPVEDQVVFAAPDSLTFPAPSISVSHSDPITLTADALSPAWDVDHHPSVDTNYFTYPTVGSIGPNEVTVSKKAMYELKAGGVAKLTGGNYFAPGLSFYADGVEIPGTLVSTSGNENVNAQSYSGSVEVELDADTVVSPGFYTSSGSQDLIGGQTYFSVQLVRETP